MSLERPAFPPAAAAEPTLSRRTALLAAAAVTTGIARAQPETNAGIEERAGDASSPSPPAARARFDVDAFVEKCRRANEESDPQAAVREVLARAVANPAAMLRGIGEPEKGGIRALHRSPTLTVLDIVWAPLMQLMPHEHNMWSLIGIYTGREDNIFWRRAPGTVEAVAAEAIAPGRAVSLPRDVIHSVANPIEKLTGAIHIYGSDFFAVPRSEWDPETLRERAGTSTKRSGSSSNRTSASSPGTRAARAVEAGAGRRPAEAGALYEDVVTGFERPLHVERMPSGDASGWKRGRFGRRQTGR